MAATERRSSGAKEERSKDFSEVLVTPVGDQYWEDVGNIVERAVVLHLLQQRGVAGYHMRHGAEFESWRLFSASTGCLSTSPLLEIEGE